MEIFNQFKEEFHGKINSLVYINDSQKDLLLNDFNKSFERMISQAQSQQANHDEFFNKVGSLIDSKIEEDNRKKFEKRLHPNAIKNAQQLKNAGR